MRNIGKFTALSAVLALSASFAYADSITIGSYGATGLFGYGAVAPTVSNTETQITSEQTFSSDIVTVGPPAVYGLPAFSFANQTAVGGNSASLDPSTVWFGPLPTSYWVGVNANAGPISTVNPDYGYYDFTTTFTAQNGAGQYSLNLSYLSDDEVEVYLNGALIAGTFTTQTLGSDTEFSTPLNVSGSYNLLGGTNGNTLSFVVEQLGTGPNGAGPGGSDPSGVDFSGTVSSAPEPNSLLLLGSGLISAAGMMFRRRKVVA